MSTVSETGVPSVGTGILQPKMSHRFMVRFSVRPNEGEDIPEALRLLGVLSKQVQTVTLPIEQFDVKVRTETGQHKLGFAKYEISSALEVQLQDDIAGDLGLAINLLARSPAVHALIMLMDGNDRVLEAHHFERMVLKSLVRSKLTYYGRSGKSFGGNLIDAKPNSRGIIHEQKINLFMDDGEVDTATLSKTLIAAPSVAYRHHFFGDAPTSAELIQKVFS